MNPYAIRRHYHWYLLPTGHELYYRCSNCGKAIEVSSIWNLLQAMVVIPASGVAIYFIARWAPGHDLEDFGVGGVLGTAALLLAFVFSIHLLYSGLRVRRDHPVA
jgi:cytochrome b subunit of formate dehydrogenase